MPGITDCINLSLMWKAALKSANQKNNLIFQQALLEAVSRPGKIGLINESLSGALWEQS